MRAGIIDSEVNDLWCVAHDSGELGTAVTSYDITGLSGDSDVEYQLIVRSIGTSAAGEPLMRFNNDAGTNYGSQYILGQTSSGSASRGIRSGVSIGYTETTHQCISETHIFAKSGKERTGIHFSAWDVYGTFVNLVMKRAFTWSNTADEITSINLEGPTDCFGIGSRIILLKKVHNDGMKTGTLTPNKIEGAWERIYDSTLSSAATTVTISDLEGDTDVIYRLILRLKNDNASASLYNIRYNNDSGSNYGKQYLTGVASVAAAGRQTANTAQLVMTITALDQNFLAFSDNLMYAKSGYERTVLSETTEDVNGTTVNTIALNGGSWSNTADEITSIVVSASQADGLGVGSVIELYRLNL